VILAKKNINNNAQKGEHEFIENVVKAIIANDSSRKHYLLDDKGIMLYKSVEWSEMDSDIEFRYENGGLVKVFCVFGKELIENFHHKAGKDDLSVPWARRSVKKVIKHGKMIANKIDWLRI